MNRFETFIPKAFNQEELDQRIAEKQAFYDASVSFTPTNLLEAFQLYEHLLASGYTLQDKIVPWISGTLITFYMQKPLAEQSADLAAIAETETAAYTSEIEAEKSLALDRMVSRLLIEAQEKTQAKEDAKQEKLEQAARAEAAEILGLVL